MTSSAKGSKSTANPYDNDLPNVGMMAILVPLIIGGACVVGALILWQQHERKAREFEASKVEEEVRTDILSAYRLMRQEKYAAAVELMDKTDDKVAFLCANDSNPDAYTDFRAALLSLVAEAEFIRDPTANAAEAEDKFNGAMSLLRYASGEMWEFSVLGRARSRFAQKKYEEAIADLDTLLAGNPNYGTAYYWRSLARKGMGDLEGAAADREVAENFDSWPPLRDPLRRSDTGALDMFKAN